MNNGKNNPPKKLNIDLPEDVSSGIYSNLVIINHSLTEFVLDFVSVMPGVPKAKVKSRIVMAPQHVKRLLKALGENLQRYESNFGEIKDPEGEKHGIPMNFGPPGEA